MSFRGPQNLSLRPDLNSVCDWALIDGASLARHSEVQTSEWYVEFSSVNLLLRRGFVARRPESLATLETRVSYH